ncbi:hypothetical protein QN277_020784 [Acacia crassicarpa]|uniref:Uncharacterized protein n=1 Tax=Acacia crassicarpa TaxID=499986 RepID=A0AAE1JKI2_9FABA|nr:hypothetical protein QN277_020784 [Acacia crassicarpa]
MDIKNNKEQNKEEAIKNSVYKDGSSRGLHVHDLHRSMLPRHLKYQPRRQKREQSRCYERSTPIQHP